MKATDYKLKPKVKEFLERSIGLYINGEYLPAVSGKTFDVINPATEEVIAQVSEAQTEDIDIAVQAARKAFDEGEWPKMEAATRSRLLYKFADLLEENREELAQLEALDNGKPYKVALTDDVDGTIQHFRYYSGFATKIQGKTTQVSPEYVNYTVHEPVGVVGQIIPWNFPLLMAAWKLGSALAVGCTVVIKPASETAVTCAKVIACLHDAGIPAGVLNMVTGSGSLIGTEMANHTEIDAITFTGSNAVGKQLAQTAISRGIKYQLEMGGKNPVIVANDADLDLAVEATISGGLRSSGQKCTATSRVIVQSEVYAQFKDKLLQKVADITIGDGMEEGTWMGPSSSENQLNTVLSAIAKGKSEGATLLFGGDKVEKEGLNGYYVEPTVFEDVSSTMTLAREEIFGPVLALMKVDTIEEALQLANDSEYGLSASIFTTKISNMLSFINEMDAGLVRINAESAGVELQAPFGGMKQSSSHSREQGQAAKEFYTAIKTVFIK